MKEFNGFYPTYNPLKDEEKRKIRKASNLIGTAFIVLWLIPDFLNSIYSDVVTKIIGFTPEVSAVISDPAFILLLQTFYSIIMFTLPFLILPVGTGKRISELALIKKPKGSLFAAFVLIGVGVSAFANLLTNRIAMVFETVGIEFLSPDITYPEGIFGMALSYIAIAVTPALVEEFATRGMVMGTARQYGELFGLITSATFFALMHGNLVQIPFAFMMGLVIGFAVIKTGSVVTGMVIHFLNNAISVSMTYLLANVESILLQGIISIGYLAFCVVLLLIGIFYAQNKEKDVWKLSEGDSLLSEGEKFKTFFLSPTVIVAIGLTVIDCINMINIR